MFFHTAIWRLLTFIASAMSVLLLDGCASPGIGITQSVRLETPDCDMALCELSNDRGHWNVTSTPGTVSITTSLQPLEIACRARDSKSPTVLARAASAIDERGMAGAVSGGVVGAGAGAAVVAPLAPLLATPAAPFVIIIVAGVAGVGAGAGTYVDEASRFLRYPDTIVVPLVCQSAAHLESEVATAPVGIVVRGLSAPEAMTAGFATPRAVIITRLAADSHAAQAGLRERDIIVRCNKADVADVAHLQAILRATGPDRPLRVVVIREGQSLEITLPPRVALP